MKELSTREKVLIIVLLFVAIFYGYYRFFLNPILISDNALRQDIKLLKQKEQSIKDAPTAKNELAQKQKEAEVLYNAAVLEVPMQRRDAEIAYDIKALCDGNGTELTSISFAVSNSGDGSSSEEQQPQSPSSGLALNSVPVVLAVKGNYNNTMKLIEAIESDTRTALTSTVSMNLDQGSKTLTTSLNLTFYYIDNGQETEESYDFNKGSYGKDSLFD